MNTVNLIPMPRRNAKRVRCCMRRWIGVCIGYALLLVVVSVVCQTASSHVDRSQGQLLREAGARIETAKEQIAALEPQLSHLRLTLAIEREIVSQPDWSVLLAILGNTLGEEILLRECELKPIGTEGQTASVGVHLVTAEDGTVRLGTQQYRLTLRGFGRSQSAVSQFILRLEDTQLFSQVQLVNTMREPVRNVEAFAFRIECVLGEPAAAEPVAAGGKP